MVSCEDSPPFTSQPYSFTTPPTKFCLESAKSSKGCMVKCRKVSPVSASTVWTSKSAVKEDEQEDEQEEPIDTEAIWEDALQCKDAAVGLSSESDSEDEWDFGPGGRQSKPIMVKLPCGDIHLCGVGYQCQYQVPNEDRIMVCMYTGVEFGPEHTDEYFDLNGGTGKHSADPDQSCGEFVHGKWRTRKDPFAASRAAFQAAGDFEVDDSAYLINIASKSEPTKTHGKRGALCVGESSPVQCGKRGRASKRNTADRGTMVALLTETETVLSKLVNYDKTSSFKQKAQGYKIERKRTHPDPRMCDEKFVFNTSVKKYVRGCLANGTAPNMDAIHNISLIAQTVSAKAREEASESGSETVRTVKFRTACANLILTLWSCVCLSPYIVSSNKGGDAYRPFVCGCLYAFKRGVTLKDGTVLIPTCPQLAAALPVLRGTGGNAMAKTLHSSSHRGMCTLSRSIASVTEADQKRVFKASIRCAERFSSQTFSKYDI